MAIILSKETSGDVSHNSLFSNPLSYFLGKDLFIETDGMMVYGKLIGFQVGSKIPIHRPTVLLLESSQGKMILRAWDRIIVGFKKQA